jgi:hypothetical protein
MRLATRRGRSAPSSATIPPRLSSAARPPEEEGDIIRTALCLRAMKTYGAPGRAPEWAARISKARHWLETAKPITAEDRDMQLLGMA